MCKTFNITLINLLWEEMALFDVSPVRANCASCCPERCTSAVPEIHMSRCVMLAQALQDLLVVDEAMQRTQDEDVQRDVADLLQLKVPAEALQAGAQPARLL